MPRPSQRAAVPCLAGPRRNASGQSAFPCRDLVLVLGSMSWCGAPMIAQRMSRFTSTGTA